MDREVAEQEARHGVGGGQPVALGVDHPHELELHRRERRERAAEAGAEERAAVGRQRQALLETRGELAEQERAHEVDAERHPRPARAVGPARRHERGAAERSHGAAGEDRRELAAVEARERAQRLAIRQRPPSRTSAMLPWRSVLPVSNFTRAVARSPFTRTDWTVMSMLSASRIAALTAFVHPPPAAAARRSAALAAVAPPPAGGGGDPVRERLREDLRAELRLVAVLRGRLEVLDR